MKNNHLLLADELKKEALDVINHPVLETFTKYGKIHFSGSAELDLLVYPDLDVYFDCYDADCDVAEIFAQAVSNAVKSPDVRSVKLAKELYKNCSNVPKGIYLQIKLKTKTNIWQIDIWYLESQKELFEKLKETEQLKSKIDSDTDKKNLILEAKHALKRPDGSTPSFSSYHVYHAVLNEGLMDIESIKEYVASRNIQPIKY
jgi:hypothetical protein